MTDERRDVDQAGAERAAARDRAGQPGARDQANPSAGPVADDWGALRPGVSSTPPSSTPPAGGSSAADAAGRSASGDAPGSGPASADAGELGREVEGDLAALLADAESKRDEYLDLARRTKADFENFRKRVAGDVQTAAARGKAELVRELIDPVDNLERALDAAGIAADGGDPLDSSSPAPPKDPEGLAQGVLLVYHGLRETLRRHGIESVDPKGEKFDPNLHEALSTQPVQGTEAGTVVEVLQKGYRMDDNLIRPARVVVSA